MSLFDEETQAYFIVSRSIESEKLPPVKKFVRVEIMFSSMRIRDIGDGDLEYTMYYFDDIKAPVPKFLIDWVSSKAIPEMLRISREQITRKGYA